VAGDTPGEVEQKRKKRTQGRAFEYLGRDRDTIRKPKTARRRGRGNIAKREKIPGSLRHINVGGRKGQATKGGNVEGERVEWRERKTSGK